MFLRTIRWVISISSSNGGNLVTLFIVFKESIDPMFDQFGKTEGLDRGACPTLIGLLSGASGIRERGRGYPGEAGIVGRTMCCGDVDQ